MPGETDATPVGPSGAGAPPPLRTDEDLRVLSWNIHKAAAPELDPARPWSRGEIRPKVARSDGR